MDEQTLKIVLAMKDQVTAVAKTIGASFKGLGKDIIGVAKGAKEAVVGIATAVGKVGSAIKATAGTIATWARNVSIAAAAFVGLNVRTAQHIDEQADLAGALGISIRTLSLLEFGAGRAGTSLQDITTAIRAITGQAQQFAAGSKEAVALFSGLGVDPTGKSPVQIIEDVATGISKITDESTRLAVANDLLGRSGFKVVELFKNNGTALRELTVDAHKFGAIIDEDLALKGSALADAWDNFKASISSVGNEVLRGAGPAITDFLNSIGESLAGSRFKVGAFFGAMGDALRELGAIWNEGGFSKNAGGLARAFGEMLRSIFVNVTPAALRSALELGKVIGAAIVDGVFSESKRKLATDLVAGGVGAQIMRKFLPDTARAEIDHLATLLYQAQEFDRANAAAAARGNGFLPGGNLAQAEFDRLAGGTVSALSPQLEESKNEIENVWKTAAAKMEDDLKSAYSSFIKDADVQTREHFANVAASFANLGERAKLQEILSLASPADGAFIGGIFQSLIGGTPEDLERLNRLLDASLENLRKIKHETIPLPPPAQITEGASDGVLEMGKLNAEMRTFAMTTAEAKKAVGETAGSGAGRTFLGGMAEEARELGAQFRDAGAIGQQAASDLHSAFSNNFFRAMRNEFKSFGEFFRSFVTDLVTGIQRQLSNGLGSLFVNLVSSFVGSLAGGGLNFAGSPGANAAGYNGVGPPDLSPGSSAFFGPQFAGGSQRSSGAGGVQIGSIALHINAIDSQSGAAFVASQMPAIASGLAAQIAQSGEVRAALQSGLGT